MFLMNAGVPRYAPPIKIFQKKKKKKRKPFVQVEGFKKASFSEKILPDTWLKTEAFNQKRNVFWNCLGGDFFWNPQGLNLLFWIPGTYLCSLFFIFYFEYSNQMLLLNRIKSEGMRVELEDGRLWKGCKILRDGWKTKSNNKYAFHPALKFYTLSFASVYCFLLVKRNGLFSWNCSWWPFLGFDFEDAWKSVGSLSVQLAEKCLMKMWSIFKKQCIILPSAMWQ